MPCGNSCGLDQGCKNPYLFYDGPENPSILVIGEAPGKEEDDRGHIFIGRSGTFLRNGLEQLGFDVDNEIGFCNVCACRPPDNRTPTKKEMKACTPNLVNTIKSVAPSVKMVLLMGNTPLQAIFGKVGITKIHGITEYIGGVPYIPLYHPAYVLRNEGTSVVDTFIADLEKVGRVYEEVNGTREKTWDYKVLDAAGLEELLPEIEKSDLLAFDTETNTLDMYSENADMICVSFAFNKATGYVVFLSHPDLHIEPEELRDRVEALKKLFDLPIPKAAQNGMFDIRFLDKVHGIKVRNLKHDTTLMAHLVDENSQRDLTALTTRYNSDMAGYDDVMAGEMKKANSLMMNIPSDTIKQYAAGDALTTWRIAKRLYKIMTDENLIDLYNNIVMPALNEYIRMTDSGVKIDEKVSNWLKDEYEKRLEFLENNIYTLPLCQEWEKVKGKKVNFASSKQVMELIYEMGKVPIQLGKKTERPTLDDNARKAILELPVNSKYSKAIDAVRGMAGIAKVRTLYKMFAAKASSWVRDDGLVHPEFLLHGTVTGRISCVPLDSEILTKDGWKTYDKLSYGEEVLGFDIQKWQYKWTRLVGISKGIDLVGKTYYGTCHDKKYCSNFVSTGIHKWISRYQDMTGYVESSCKLRGVEKVLQPEVLFPDVSDSILTPEESFLLGWYLTDGFKTGEANYGLSMQLVKTRSINLLKEYLDKYEISYTCNRYKYKSKFDKEDGHYKTEFHISSNIFNKIYNIYYNMDPSKLIISLSKEARESMFLAMLEGDGSMRRDKKNYDRFGALDVQKKRTPEVFELLSLSLGQPYSHRFSNTVAGKRFVNYSLLKKELVNNKNLSWEQMEEMEVWCPETELGTWVMRQGHGICITGNCKSPNVQQVPKEIPDDEWLKEHSIKTMFVSKYPNGCLVSVDYSQLELRLMACISGDSLMLETYRNDGDIHETTARRLFPDYDKVDPDVRKKYRSAGKTMNFKSIYSLDESYLKIYPGVAAYAKQTLDECKRLGYVANAFGRRRRLPAIKSFNRTEFYHAYLQACNFKIQSLGHDLLMYSLIKVAKRLRKENLRGHLILDIHDALMVDAEDREEAIKIAKIMKEEMESVGKFDWALIPIRADASIGRDWQSMKEVDDETK